MFDINNSIHLPKGGNCRVTVRGIVSSALAIEGTVPIAANPVMASALRALCHASQQREWSHE
jgi:hypothetical protein